MAVVCCATPSELYLEETRSTLQFASRAKLVKTNAQVNEVLDDRSTIRRLQKELAEAKRQCQSGVGGSSSDHVVALETQTASAKFAAREAEIRLERLKASILNHGAVLGKAGNVVAESPKQSRRKRRFSDGGLPSGAAVHSPVPSKGSQVVSTPRTNPRPTIASRLILNELPQSSFDELALVKEALRAKTNMNLAVNEELEQAGRLANKAKSELAAESQKASNLQVQLASKTKSIEELQEGNMKLKDALREKCEQLEVLKKENISAFADIEASVDKLQEEKMSLQQQMKSVKQEMLKEAEHAAKTKQELHAIHDQETDRLQEEICNANCRTEQAYRELQESQKQIKELQSTLQDTARATISKEERLVLVEKESAGLRESISRAEKQLEELQANLDATVESNIELSTNVSELEAMKTEQEVVLKDLVDSLDQQSKMTLDDKAEIRRLREVVARNEYEYSQLVSDFDERCTISDRQLEIVQRDLQKAVCFNASKIAHIRALETKHERDVRMLDASRRASLCAWAVKHRKAQSCLIESEEALSEKKDTICRLKTKTSEEIFSLKTSIKCLMEIVAESDSKISSSDELSAEYKKMSDSLILSLKEREGMVSQLESDNQCLSVKIAQLEDSVATANKKSSVLESEVHLVKETYDKLMNEHASLNDSNGEKQKMIDSLLLQVETAEHHATSCEKQIDETQSLLRSKFSKTESELIQRIEELKKEALNARAIVRDLEDTIESNESAKKNLESMVQILQSERDEATLGKKDALNKLHQLETDVHSLESQLSKQSNGFIDLSQKLQQAQETVVNTECELLVKNDSISCLERKLSQIELECQGLKEEAKLNEQLVSRVTSLETELLKSVRQLEEKNRKMDQQDIAIRKEQCRAGELEQQLQQLLEETSLNKNADTEALLQEKSIEVENLKTQLGDVERELRLKAEEKMKRLRLDNKDLLNRVKIAEDEAYDARQKWADLDEKYDDAQKRLERSGDEKKFRAEINRLQKEMESKVAEIIKLKKKTLNKEQIEKMKRQKVCFDASVKVRCLLRYLTKFCPTGGTRGYEEADW